MNPRHPIYIVSKGRADRQITMRALDKIAVPYRVIVEEQEFEAYAKTTDRSKLLVLDRDFQRSYDTCDDLGDTKSKGPGPARNFAWDHALSLDASWHWVMDDNIYGFYRLNRNSKVPVADGTIFAAMEDFVERYTNVAMAGPSYVMFTKRKQKLHPIILNTRIYSCNLIRNDVPLPWRARYNEDTDLSLRMLKAGWCTVQFNAFLQNKAATQTVKGGNTAEFYSHEGTLPKSKMLVELHPDCAQLRWKFGRHHHSVDYKRFRTKLKRRDGVEIKSGVDDYGMQLVTNETAGTIGERP